MKPNVLFFILAVTASPCFGHDECPNLDAQTPLQINSQFWSLASLNTGEQATLVDVSFSRGPPSEMQILKYDENEKAADGASRVKRYAFGGDDAVWITCNYRIRSGGLRLARDLGRARSCVVTVSGKGQAESVAAIECTSR